MKVNKKIIALVVVVLVGAAVTLKIVGSASSSETRRQNLPLVQVELPHREAVMYTLVFTGDVLPIQQANVYSKVTGNIDRIVAEMGTYAKEGQLLALIDTTELAQQFRQAAATYENARMSYDRTKELSEQNLVAKQDLDNADASMKVAKANYENAQTRLGYAWVIAPFSGFVTKRYFDAGSLVSSNNSVLYTLMDQDSVKIIVNVLEKNVALVAIGRKAVVSVDAYPGREFHGMITRFSGAVDLSTRTMETEIDIPNHDHLLKPGMYANVALIVDEHKDALTVPSQALLKDEKGSFVFSVGNRIALRKNVNAGIEQNGRTEILSGLEGKENIVTLGQQFLKDSAKVIIQQ